MNTRAFLGAFAALSLAAACPQTAQRCGAGQPVRLAVGQPHAAGQHDPRDGLHRRPRLRDRRRRHRAADRRRRRDLDRPGRPAPRRTSTRVQAVTPDVIVILGGDGCVVRRSDDGGKTFRKIFVLAETNCPDQVAAALLRHPAGRLPAAAQRQRPAHHRRRPDLRPRHRDPRHAGQRRRRPGRPRRRDLHHPRRRHRLPQRHQHRVPHDRRGRVVDARARRRARQRAAHEGRQRDRRSTPSARTRCCAPPTAARRWQRRAGGDGSTITGIGCATDDLCLLTTDRGDKLLRTEDGGATRGADHRQHRRRSTPPASRPRPARSRPAAGGATAVSDDAGRNYAPVGGDIAGSLPVRPAARPGAGHRARARRPRPTRAHDRQRPHLEGDQRRHLGRHAGHVVHHRRPRLRARPARRPVPHRQRRRELAADRPRHDQPRRRP